MPTVQGLLDSLDGPPAAVYLVVGELVLAEPAAERLARGLAERAGCRLQVHRHPPRLAPLFEDLRTFSLFEPAKVLLAIDTALLADKKAAADLVDQAAEVLPLASESPSGDDLGSRERQAASRLLQALRLFGVDPDAGEPRAAVESLPKWAVEGGAAYRKGRSGRGRGKRQIEDLIDGLAALLGAARDAGVAGYAEGEVAELGSLADGGLPDGHCLVLAERSADVGHPVVRGLEQAGRVVRLASLEEEQRGPRKGQWNGLDDLAAEMQRQTGVDIEPGALAELARRTLKGDDDRKSAAADPDSAGRFSGEYRKLANLAQGLAGEAGARITRQLVADSVTDRGEEDVWALLDAVGEGRAGEALARLDRMLSGSGDPIAGRLSFFALLAGFCRTLTAVRGLMQVHGVRPGEGNYGRFKSSLEPRLKAALPGGGKNPIGNMHPYRLHRAYLAAGRLPDEVVHRLPAWVLDTEFELKGESGDPDTALAHLVARLAGAGQGEAPGALGGPAARGPRRR